MNIIKITPEMLAAGLAALGKNFRLKSEAVVSAVFLAMDAARGPIKMILYCPACGHQHIDAPEQTSAVRAEGFDYGDGPLPRTVVLDRWTNPPHRSHFCNGCAHIWRPADVCTEGVREIATRGEKDDPRPTRAQ